MPDIRYHFVYLIAVFLMLGVGMLVGASFVGPDQVKRQTTLIRDVRAQANQAMQEAQASHDQLQKTEDALGSLLPMLVRGKLAGKRVAVLQTGDYSDATQDAAAALREAGAESVATVTLSAKWGEISPADQAVDIAKLARALCAGANDNIAAQVLQNLQDQGMIAVVGDLSQGCSLFALVGGAKDDSSLNPPGALDGKLVEHLQTASHANAVIVGCEPFDAAVSFIPAYQSAGIATVDCIDRPLGQLALPFALRGGPNTDDYGLKPTAKRLVPITLEAQTSQ